MNTFLALTKRDIVRTLRQPSRLIGLFGTVLIFWLVLASGFGDSFAPPAGVSEAEAGSYAAYMLPGTITMVVLFGTVVAAITLIQDRQAGFLQSVLVSPAPASSVAASKSVSGLVWTFAQALPLVLAGTFVGVELSAWGVFYASIAIACAALGVLNIGLLLAWRIDSVSGFHSVMNIILLPMWLLSGALFPASGATGWMAIIMHANPLHWCHSCLAGAMGTQPSASGLMWAGCAAFGVLPFVLACAQIARRKTQ